MHQYKQPSSNPCESYAAVSLYANEMSHLKFNFTGQITTIIKLGYGFNEM